MFSSTDYDFPSCSSNQSTSFALQPTHFRRNQVSVLLGVRIDTAILAPLQLSLGRLGVVLVAVQACHRGADLDQLVVSQLDAHVGARRDWKS